MSTIDEGPHGSVALALGYIERGWSPVPIPRGSKAPVRRGWETMRVTGDNASAYFTPTCNIGVLLGEASGGLTDVDLDCPAAVMLAPRFLPNTGAVFGRSAKPRSHWLYVASGAAAEQFRDPADGATLVEVRATTSKGTSQQTVFPGSIHPCGELIAWSCELGEPARVEQADLRVAVARLSACCLLSRHFPGAGGRHRATLALIGALLRGRVDANDAEHIVRAVRDAAGADPGKPLASMISDSAIRLDRDEVLLGVPALCGSFGDKVARRALSWLGLDVNPLATPERLPPGFTEDDIALAFEARHGADVLFNVNSQRWHLWTGAQWRVDESRRAFHYARELCREVWAKAPREEKPPNIRKASIAEAVERFARAVPRLSVNSDTFDSDPWLLGTPDGTVDLRTGLLGPSNRKDRITRLVAVSPAPTASCPRWRTFLAEATLGDTELQHFLQQMAGYCLTGITREHALFYGHGGGGNGKSVFQNTLRGIWGDYARVAPIDTFTATRGDKHPTELAMLQGARLVLASETEEGKAWAEAKIKQLTGGDPVSARYMRQDFFEFTPQFKLFIIGNHAPVLHNVDDAARRRFNILPFVHKPPKPDRHLEEALRAEWPGILRWAIEGCLDWQERGLIKPASVSVATDDYFDEQDMTGQWLHECCEVGPNQWDPFAKLFASWTTFAKSMGEEPGSAKAFSGLLVKRGFRRHKATSSRRDRAFKGLSVRFDPSASGIQHD